MIVYKVKQINLAIKRGLDQKILYCPQGHSNSYKLFKQEKVIITPFIILRNCKKIYDLFEWNNTHYCYHPFIKMIG